MKRFLNRMLRDNRGFTLVELLIVITILGILAAIALPNFTGITERGDDEAAAVELGTIQTAVDTMMANERISSVTASGPTSDMSAFPTGNPLYPDYLRTAATSENYTTTTTGLVSQTLIP